MGDSWRRAGPVAGFAVLLAVVAFVHWRLHPYAFDDAYIHFRIARHLAQDGVPYYNIGEAVMASSSSVWTLVLAGLFACGATPAVVALVNALLTTCCVPVYARLIATAADDGIYLRHHVAAAMIVVPALIMASAGLMETPLAILVAGLATRLFQRGRQQAFALFGIAAFIRPELAILAAMFAVFGVHEQRMGVVEILAWGLAGALPFIAYDLYFFHTLIPNTVRAKAIGYQLGWHEALPRLVPALADSPALRDWAMACAAALVAGLLLLFRPMVDSTARASFVAAILVAIAYAAPRGFVFEWYVPLYMVPALWPLAALALRERKTGLGPIARRALAAIALAVLILPSWLPLPAMAEGAWINPALSPLFAQGARARQYIEVARGLARRYPRATLLSSEVGGLGEGFPGRIEDGFGLVSPAALRFHPMPVPAERSSGTLGAIPPAFVAQVRPGLIVSYDVLAEALARSPAVAGYIKTALPLFTEDDARKAAQVGVTRELWGHRLMLDIWVRRDLATAAGLPLSDTPPQGASRP